VNGYVIDIAFQAAAQDAEAFDAFLDRVMDELSNIGVESDVTASLSRYEASFSIPAADLSADSLIASVAALRTALHAAECGTPGWPSAHEWLGTRGIAAELVS
jgi:hypothetical protein